jgi:hypothetical protein
MEYEQKAIQMHQYRSSPATTTISMFVRLMNSSTSDQFLYESAFQQLKVYKRQSGKKITFKKFRNILIKK